MVAVGLFCSHLLCFVRASNNEASDPGTEEEGSQRVQKRSRLLLSHATDFGGRYGGDQAGVVPTTHTPYIGLHCQKEYCLQHGIFGLLQYTP